VILIKEESGGPPSARRFVTLRASENNVMRKLEVHGPFASLGCGNFHAMCAVISSQQQENEGFVVLNV